MILPMNLFLTLALPQRAAIYREDVFWGSADHLAYYGDH